LAKAAPGDDADACDKDSGEDEFADLGFDPHRLLNGDRVVVDFSEIDSYDREGERVAGLTHLDLDPALDHVGPRFKAVVPYQSRNGGWECGGPLRAIRPVSSTVRETTSDRDSYQK